MNSENRRLNTKELHSSDHEEVYARLVFMEGKKVMARKDILKHCTLIGSAPKSNIQLISSTVSYIHCVVTLESDRLELRDLRSEKGTTLNGSSIDHATLTNGDIIIIGRFTCKVETNLPRWFFDQQSDQDKTTVRQKEIEQALAKDPEDSRFYARLVFEDQNSKQLQKNIFKHSTLIGSSKGCNIQLVARDISSVHCMILLSHGLLYIHDLRSTNGTEVNDVKVNNALLTNGDRIRLGRLEFTVETNVVPSAVAIKPEAIKELPDNSESAKQQEKLQKQKDELNQKSKDLENQLRELDKNQSEFEDKYNAFENLKSDFQEKQDQENKELDKSRDDFLKSKTEFENYRQDEEERLKEELQTLQELQKDLNQQQAQDSESADTESSNTEAAKTDDQSKEKLEEEWNNLANARALLRTDQTNFQIEQQRRVIEVELHESEVERLQKEVDLQKSQLEEKEAEFHKVQSEFEQGQQELSEKQSAGQSDSEENEDDQLNLDEKKNDILKEWEKLQADRDEFEAKRIRITEELSQSRQKHEKKQAELDESHDLLSQKQNQLLEQIEKRASAEVEHERVSNDIRQKQDKLDRDQKEFQQIFDDLQEKQDGSLEQKLVNEEKHSELSSQVEKLIQREADLAERELELEKSRAELEHNRGAFEQFVEEKNKLEEQKTFVKQKENELLELNEQISSLQKETGNRTSELETAKEGFENQRSSFEEKMIEQEKQLLEYEKQIEIQKQDLEQQKSGLQKEQLDLEDEKSRLHNKAERLTQHAEQYEHRQSVQEGMAQQLESQRNQLQADLNRVREEIKETQTHLKQYQQETETERQALIWERQTFEQERRVLQQQKADLYREQKKALSDPNPSGKEISLTKRLLNRSYMTQFQADWFLEGSFKNYLIDGRYELLSLLDTGGMGWLYCALDRETNRKVVLKIIQAPNLSDPGLLLRFRQESKATLQIKHPNVIQSLYYGENKEFHYLVMEYMEGINMIELVRLHGPIPYQMACSLMIQVAAGLKCIHEQNMVHRDIKPSNFLIDQKGQLKILDFGLVLINEDKEEDEFTLAMLYGHDCLGTADYIAPEQSYDSFQVDYRADFYSLGCAFYYALTGTVPFPEKNNLEKIEAHRTRVPQHVSQIVPGIPRQIVQVVDKLLSKKPEQRFQSMRELVQEIKPFAKMHPVLFDHSIILKMREEKAKARLFRMAEMVQDQSTGSDDTGAGNISNSKTYADLREPDKNP